MSSLFKNQAREIFYKAISEYMESIAVKLDTDIKVSGTNGILYTTKGNLLTATYALQSFTEDEAEYFYRIYDELWQMGAYIEAYSLMRLVFGAMNKKHIERLYRQGHLFTTREVFNYAHRGEKP